MRTPQIEAGPSIVVISDLHVGCPASVATERLATDWIKSVIRQQTSLAEVILLGDTMDLTACSLEVGITFAREFFGAAFPSEPGVPRLTYVLGNHDHHLWAILDDHRKLEHGSNPLCGTWQTPCLGSDPLLCREVWAQQSVLGGIFPPSLREVSYFQYPYLIRDLDRRYILHHGHYLDRSICPLIPVSRFGQSNLTTFEEINAPWVEAVWYFSGQSDKLRDAMSRGYRAARSAGLVLGVPLRLVRLALNILGLKNRAVRPRLVRRIRAFVEHFIPQSESYVFIFGHTHASGRVALSTMEAYNTGGWVVERRHRRGLMPDAGALVLQRGGTPKWLAMDQLPDSLLRKRWEFGRRPA